MTSVPPEAPPPDPRRSTAVPPVTIGYAQQAPWRNMAGLTTALTILLWCAFGVSVLLVGATINQRLVIEDFANGRGVTLDDANAADNLVGGTSVLLLTLMTALAVLVMVFLWRGSKNLEAKGRLGARLGPGWSIGAWFIPLANLVMPVLIVQDQWRGTDPHAGPDAWRGRVKASALVGWWWALWVAAWVASGLGGGVGGGDTLNEAVSDARAQSTGNIVFALAITAASVLAVFVFRTLGQRFERLRTLP